MTNPNNSVGTNGAYGGRTSVEAFNDVLGAFQRGVLSGWACVPDSGLTVSLGGDGTTRDVAIAADNAGNKTTINNISGAPIGVTISAAPASNSRIDAIVAYVDNPPSGTSTVADNPAACGLIVVEGTASVSPLAPTENDIRTAITADGASGSTAFFVVLATVIIASGTTDITAGDITAGDNANPLPQTGVVLFSGDSNNNIVLADDAANYAKMTIYFRNNDYVYSSVTVNDPDGKIVDLTSSRNTDAAVYMKSKSMSISGTSITQLTGADAHDVAFTGNTSSVTVNTDLVYITRVEAWVKPDSPVTPPDDAYNPNYSLAEVDTGAKWINGEAIYKKTINFGAMPNNTQKTVAHGITNLGKVIKMEGYAYNGNTFLHIPHVATNDTYNLQISVNSTDISITDGADQSGYSESYITLYYTKTS